MDGGIKRFLEPEYRYRARTSRCENRRMQVKTRGANCTEKKTDKREMTIPSTAEEGRFNIDIIVAVEIASLRDCILIRKKVRTSRGKRRGHGQKVLCNFSLTYGP